MATAQEVASLYGTLALKGDGINQLKNFRGEMDQTHGGLLSFIKTMAGLGGIIATALGGLSLGAMIKEAADAQLITKQLGAVLKSTGGIAGVTADQATALATSLEGMTRYSDEAVLSAENLLLTFTSIKSNIFPDATKIVLDMSTALGQDLKSSAIELGKALQDPVLGVTALKRVGVNFTDTQMQQIKYFAQTNQLAKAQAMIMAELTREFGGSAIAAGDTFAGKLDILKNKFGDLLEMGGNLILPALTAGLTFANGLLAGVQQGLGGLGKVVADGIAAGNLGLTLSQMASNARPLVFNLLRALGLDSASALQISGEISKFFAAIGQTIGDAITTLFSSPSGPTGIFQGKTIGPQVGLSFVDRIKRLLGITPDLETQLGLALGQIKDAVAPVLTDLVKGIQGFFSNLQGVDPSGIEKIVTALGQFGLMMGGLSILGLKGLVEGLASALPPLGTGIKDLVNAVGFLMDGKVDNALNALAGSIGNLALSLILIPVNVIDAITKGIGQLLGLQGDTSLLDRLNNTIKVFAGLLQSANDEIERLKALTGGGGTEGGGAANPQITNPNALPGGSQGGPSGPQVPIPGGGGTVPLNPRARVTGGGTTSTFPSYDSGGTFYAGQMMGVGKKAGYELFIPGFSGQAIPETKLGGGGHTTIVNNNYNVSPRQVMDLINRTLKNQDKPPLGAGS